MCLGCWAEEGFPFERSVAAQRWAPVFDAVNPYGPLHVVVDDWNLDDGSLISCGARAQTDDERQLLNALLLMSDGERWATALLASTPGFDPDEWRSKLED